MKNTENLIERRAVSPVIATVILVAVTITVAVGVSYWMSGIAGQYTSFEKIEITSGYSVKVGGPPETGWDLIVTLKNSGSSTATLINCFLNEQIVPGAVGSPLAGVTATTTANGDIGGTDDKGITIDSGESVEVTIGVILFTSDFSSSGTTLNVKLHSAGGMDYIKLIQLP